MMTRKVKLEIEVEVSNVNNPDEVLSIGQLNKWVEELEYSIGSAEDVVVQDTELIAFVTIN